MSAHHVVVWFVEGCLLALCFLVAREGWREEIRLRVSYGSWAREALTTTLGHVPNQPQGDVGER